MDSTRVSVSLKGECSTVSSNQNKDTTKVVIPHYLRPSSSSCHDICKYGRRRRFEEQPTKPLHKKTRKLSIIVPTHMEIKDINHDTTRARIHSPMQNTSSDAPQVVKRGVSMHEKAQLQLKDIYYVGSKMPTVCRGRFDQSMKLSASFMLKPSIPISNYASFQEEDKEIKNSGKEIARMDIENVQSLEEDQTEIATTKTECESVIDAPSSSSHREDVEDSDKSIVSQRKRNNTKRWRKTRFFKSGDENNRPIKLKFRIGNSLYLHKENNVARRHQFKSKRVDKTRVDDSVSENKSIRIGSLKASRTKDKHSWSKNRRRYGKTRILVLENRKRDSKTKYQDNDDIVGAELLSRKKNLHHHKDHVRRKKDVQYLFSYVIEETASKLAERRKGMVKSLVGAFESLISLQTRNCYFRVAKMNA